MYVILKDDMIIKICHEADPGAVEIPAIPAGVGLERLRVDISLPVPDRLIDLARLERFWIEAIAGGYILHAVEIPGAERLNMPYSFRKRLVTCPGQPTRIKTDQELADEAAAAARQAQKTERRKVVRDAIGDADDQIELLRAQIKMILDHLAEPTATTASYIADLRDATPALSDTYSKTIHDSLALTEALDALDTKQSIEVTRS